MVNSIYIALHLIIIDENRRVIMLLIESLHQYAIRNIANIVGVLYNSSVIIEINITQILSSSDI